MQYLSLFSGIGSESLAWSNLGWNCLAHSEIDKTASSVLSYHYPQIPNLGDVTKVGWEAYEGRCDLMIGGSPCQSFSVAGERKGLESDYGNLMLEYINAIKTVKPRFFIWENVVGVLSNKTNPFGAFLSHFLGGDDPLQPNKRWGNYGLFFGKEWSIAYKVVNSEYFGVPHRRRRIYVLGFNYGNCGGLRSQNWGRLERLAGIPASILFDAESYPKCSEESNGSQEKTTPSYQRKNGSDHVAKCLTTRANRSSADENYVVVGDKVRFLTPIEFERLQGFPNNYTLIPHKKSFLSNTARYKLVGNAMTVPVLSWLGHRIESHSLSLDILV